MLSFSMRSTTNGSWLRRTAIETLAAVGPAGNREAALELIQAVRRQDPVIALEIGEAFGKFGTSAKQVVPELGALLRNVDIQLRESVLMLLSQLGPKAAPAAPDVIWLLERSVHDKRYATTPSYILWLLDRIGPEATTVVPVLTDLLLTPVKGATETPLYSRTSLIYTLMQIGLTARALPALREMLQSEEPTEVACAAHGVGLLGPQAADTAPLLLRPLRPTFKDSMMTSGFFYGYLYETSARLECIRALAHLGPAAKEALPLLQTYADTPDPALQRTRLGFHSLKEEAQIAIRAITQTKEAL